MTFSQRLKKIMEERKITAYRLSKIIDVHQTTIKNWITGATRPNDEKIIAISKALEVNPSYLIGWEENEKTSVNMEAENNAAKEIIEGLQKGTAMIAGKGKDGIDTIPVSDEEFEVMKNMLEAMRRSKEK